MADEEELLATTVDGDDDAEVEIIKYHLEERAQLIDAARESARTFDKAVLTFGAAVFGFSIAFLKDVAPHPASETLKWLGSAWALFSLGLLSILVAFLFGQQACHFEISEGSKALTTGYQRGKNHWSTAAHLGNALCVIFLFSGLACWSKFAFDNLSHVDVPPANTIQAAPKEGSKGDPLKQNDTPGNLPLKKTYTPPRTPPPAPKREPSPAPTPSKKP